MKEDHWTSWIPQGRPKEECSCEHIYPSKKGKNDYKGGSEGVRVATDTTRPEDTGPGRGTVSHSVPNGRAVIPVSPQDRALSQRGLFLKFSGISPARFRTSLRP